MQLYEFLPTTNLQHKEPIVYGMVRKLADLQHTVISHLPTQKLADAAIQPPTTDQDEIDYNTALNLSSVPMLYWEQQSQLR
ncbi:hypothetical protein KDH_47250 [Dictyobacter sp. S3.2.2.5]|uniref:Uncharacterized protein n=1 Tax=Dictyobacter halimunensis TaxID=3026934 RepID=A0ABQ6FZE9_9CHLR|nr:hypothetical protein KDH_47250 [Dictyobacter sp. S3.2.2.5]